VSTGPPSGADHELDDSGRPHGGPASNACLSPKQADFGYLVREPIGDAVPLYATPVRGEPLLDQTVSKRQNHRVSAVRRSHFRDEALNPFLHGVLGKHHRGGDSLVRVTLGEIPQVLEIAR